MKILFLIIFLAISCSPNPDQHRSESDDYVLVEFAAKLEEDYQATGELLRKESPDSP